MEPISFIQGLIDFLFRSASPEAAKRRSMKILAKRIQNNRNSMFYRSVTKELTPMCGKFFYHIYKAVYSARDQMPDLLRSAAMRNQIIEQFVGREILAGFENLSAERIAERARGKRPEAVGEELRREFTALAGSIGMGLGAQIDSCYNLILAMGQFVSFDFYALLRRFGFTEQGHNFRTTPEFTAIRAEPVIGLIQDFVEAVAAVDPAEDWRSALKLLKSARNGGEVINVRQWYNVLSQLRDVLHTGIFELIIQHATDDPYWTMVPGAPGGGIFSDWLEIKRQTMEMGIAKLATSQWSNQIGTLIPAVFGNTAVTQLKYYNGQSSDLYRDKGFEGYAHAASLACLSTFLRQIFAKETQEFCDLLNITAQWNSSFMALPLGEESYAMQGFIKQLDDFDASLSNTGSKGVRLITALTRFGRDPSQSQFIKELLAAVNNEALVILTQTTAALVNIAGHVEAVKQDYFKSPPTLIKNWRELEVSCGRNMELWVNTVSDKLEKFIALARLFMERYK
jgi:hypothetical protein